MRKLIVLSMFLFAVPLLARESSREPDVSINPNAFLSTYNLVAGQYNTAYLEWCFRNYESPDQTIELITDIERAPSRTPIDSKIGGLWIVHYGYHQSMKRSGIELLDLLQYTIGRFKYLIEHP